METKELMEMGRRWSTDKRKIRMMAHGRSISGTSGMDELYNTANLLMEAEIALDKAILITSAKES